MKSMLVIVKYILDEIENMKVVFICTYKTAWSALSIFFWKCDLNPVWIFPLPF